MSYMDQNTAFASLGGIQEMNFDEINYIAGGSGFLAPLGAWLTSPSGVATIAAVGGVVTAGIALVAVTMSDDCKTVTKYDIKDRVAATITTCE